MKKRNTFKIFASMLLAISSLPAVAEKENPFSGAVDEMQEYLSQEKANFDHRDLTAEKIESTVKDIVDNTISPLRREALESIAYSLGSQAGLARGAVKGNRFLEDFNRKKGNLLDRTFDFDLVKVEEGVVAPIIHHGYDVYHQPKDNQARMAKKVSVIHKQARFTSVPLNWRDYLFIAISTPEAPEKEMLPETPAEKKLWNKIVKKGWDEGLDLAYGMYQDNFKRLVSDYTGMVEYHKGVAVGNVKRVVVKRKELGTTNRGNELLIGDTVILKQEDARFKTPTKSPSKKKKTSK